MNDPIRIACFRDHLGGLVGDTKAPRRFATMAPALNRGGGAGEVCGSNSSRARENK
jgi:hypothetical protein